MMTLRLHARLMMPFLIAMAWLMAATPLPTGAQEMLDPSNPDDVIAMNRKLQCSTIDGKTAFYWWSGRVYSRIEGQKDKHIFNVYGMNARQCGSIEDEERGTGYRMVSREIMLYTDPETDEVLESWDNPFTGETVEVLHVQNDPVNGRPSFPIGRDGTPIQFRGTIANDTVMLNVQVPLYYTNPLGGEYQSYVGGAYHAMEMFNFWAPEADMRNPEIDDVVGTDVGWTRLAQWLPWMEMGNLQGLMVFHAMGKKVAGIEDMPEVLQEALEGDFALYAGPPPLDDDRPNETSWTYFKKVAEPKNPGRL